MLAAGVKVELVLDASLDVRVGHEVELPSPGAAVQVGLAVDVQLSVQSDAAWSVGAQSVPTQGSASSSSSNVGLVGNSSSSTSEFAGSALNIRRSCEYNASWICSCRLIALDC